MNRRRKIKQRLANKEYWFQWSDEEKMAWYALNDAKEKMKTVLYDSLIAKEKPEMVKQIPLSMGCK